MTITFLKNRPNKSDKPPNEEAGEQRQEHPQAREKRLTANTKRRLRRERIEAEKVGIIIPYEPRSRHKAANPDVPKPSTHSERVARKRDAGEMAEWGLTGGPSSSVTKMKKKNKTPAPMLDDGANDAGATGNPDGDQPEVATEEPKKKRRKQLKKKKKIEGGTPTAENSSEQKSEEILQPKEEVEVKQEDEMANLAKDNPVKKHRFILFIGNLPYEITEAEIRSHFAKAGKIVSVRISKHVDKAMAGKCKGFAHLELADDPSYLKALSMHHSKLNGRRINVEYSSGQTKEMRIAQKEKTQAIKAALASGDTQELENPTQSKNKKKDKKRKKKEPANAVWL